MRAGGDWGWRRSGSGRGILEMVSRRRAVDQVDVLAMASDPAFDERAQRKDLPISTAHVIQRRPGQRRADALTFVCRVDLGVSEHDQVFGQLVLDEAGHLRTHPRLVAGAIGIVTYLHVGHISLRPWSIALVEVPAHHGQELTSVPVPV